MQALTSILSVLWLIQTGGGQEQAPVRANDWPAYVHFAAIERAWDLGDHVRTPGPPAGFNWDRVSVEWEAPLWGEEMSPSLLFRGTMQWSDQAGEHRAINWLQGVRLLVARHGEGPLDWGNGHDTLLTAWSDGVLSDQGRFELLLPLSEIYRTPEALTRFQIGLVPAMMQGTLGVWRSSSPVLSGSVMFQAIPGPSALTVSAQKVSAVGGIRAQVFQPHSAIVAANYLLSIGREEALRALEEFMRIATAESVPEPADPTNSDHARAETVFLMVRLLFHTRDGEQYPVVQIGQPIPLPPAAVCAEFESFPLVVIHDVPFVLTRDYLLTGAAQHARDHLEWARSSAVWRERPMQPANDPVEAMQELLERLRRIDRDYAAQVEPMLLEQLQRSLGSLQPPTHSLAEGSHHSWPKNVRWDDIEQAWVGEQ